MKRFKKILFVVSGAFDATSPAFKRAQTLAESNFAELCLLKVLPPLSTQAFEGALGMTLPEIEDRMQQEEADKLAHAVSELTSTCQITSTVKLGKNYLEAIRLALHEHYDLVIKVAENPGWLDRLFGSDDMHLLRKCPCPVWLMKEDETQVYKQILAAVDFDRSNQEFGEHELNQMIVELASSFAIAEFASLHVLNVYDVPSAGFISLWVNKPELVEQQMQENEYQLKKSALRSLLDWLKQKMGTETYRFLAPSMQVIQGHAAQKLPEIANQEAFDLVVMGTVGRSGIAGLIMGNTAESVLSQLNCSVLVVKPAGFVSPVA